MNLKIKINREIDLKDQIQEQLEEFRNKTIKNNAINFSPIAKRDLISKEIITETNPRVIKNFQVGKSGKCRFQGLIIRWTVISKQYLLITYLNENEYNSEPGEIICSRAKWNLILTANKEAFKDLVGNTDFQSEFNKPIISKERRIIFSPSEGDPLDIRKSINITLTLEKPKLVACSIIYDDLSFRDNYSKVNIGKTTIKKILSCRNPELFFKERQINKELIEGFLNEKKFILTVFIKDKFGEAEKTEISVIITNKKELLLQVINDQVESLLRQVETDQIEKLKKFIQYYGETDPEEELKNKILKEIEKETSKILEEKIKKRLIEVLKESFESATESNYEEVFIFTASKIRFVLEDLNKLEYNETSNEIRNRTLNSICNGIKEYFAKIFKNTLLDLSIPAYGDILGYADLVEITETIPPSEQIPENSIFKINSFYVKTSKNIYKSKVNVTIKIVKKETIKIYVNGELGEEIEFKGVGLEDVDKLIKTKLSQYEEVLENIKFIYPDIEEIEFKLK